MYYLYVLGFILAVFPPRGPWGLHEREAVARDIASTDCSPLEALTLANIAAWESGFDTKAKGRQGERGAFQVMPPGDPGARSALRLLRLQGILGYMGCPQRTERCEAMADRRTFPAKLYFWAHDPPVAEPQRILVSR